MYRLSIGMFTFDRDPLKGQGKGHAHLDSEYLGKVIDRVKLLLTSNCKS